MRPINDLLKKHGGTIWSLHPQETVYDALKTLSEKNVGALMVMDEGALVGVFSERDYTRKIALAGRASKDTLVKDIMTANVITVAPQVRTRDCLALMSRKKIRHLPVVDGDRVCGFVSIGDLVKYRIDAIVSEAEAMRSYIQSA